VVDLPEQEFPNNTKVTQIRAFLNISRASRFKRIGQPTVTTRQRCRAWQATTKEAVLGKVRNTCYAVATIPIKEQPGSELGTEEGAHADSPKNGVRHVDF